MSAQTKYFKLGAFVLTAIAVGVTALVVLGAGTIMRKKVMVETYMDESVQGLEAGAPVKFRGVTVGRLEKIELQPFRDAMRAGVKSIMVSHVAVPAIDPSGTPATLSRSGRRGSPP